MLQFINNNINISNDLLFFHKLANECDYIYPPYYERYEKQFQHLNKGLFDFKQIKPNSIIFADLTFIFEFHKFNEIEVPFILVSADNDYNVPFITYKNPNFEIYKLLENKNLIHWYSININFYHPKLSPIPIGLPKHLPAIYNHLDTNFVGWCVNSYIEQTDTFFQNFNSNPDQYYYNNFKKEKNQLIYIKMTIVNTDYDTCYNQFIDIRKNALKYFKKHLHEFNITQNLNDSKLTDFHSYINDMKNYKFCLSLPGKGIDCYRTWEALSIGVIPIVFSSPINSLYKDLPVVIINDIEEITPAFLDYHYQNILKNFNNYKFEKLLSNFWIKKIRLTFNFREFGLESPFEKIKFLSEVYIGKAESNISLLPKDFIENNNFIYAKKIKHLMNNFCSIDNCRLLLIGNDFDQIISSSCIYGNNNINITLLNYWDDKNIDFLQYKNNLIEKFNDKVENITILNENFFFLDIVTKIAFYNTLIFIPYDDHRYNNFILTKIVTKLEKNTIFLFLNWNNPTIRENIHQLIKSLNIEFKFGFEIITHDGDYENWSNGCGIFILK
jgi:hypothetical protein